MNIHKAGTALTPEQEDTVVTAIFEVLDAYVQTYRQGGAPTDCLTTVNASWRWGGWRASASQGLPA